MNTLNENIQVLRNLKSLVNRGVVYVVGRTAYRSAMIDDVVFSCPREMVFFLESKIEKKDNHVVLIFQVLWGENGWVEGTYYAFLHDDNCQIGKQIIYKNF